MSSTRNENIILFQPSGLPKGSAEKVIDPGKNISDAPDRLYKGIYCILKSKHFQKAAAAVSDNFLKLLL